MRDGTSLVRGYVKHGHACNSVTRRDPYLKGAEVISTDAIEYLLLHGPLSTESKHHIKTFLSAVAVSETLQVKVPFNSFRAQGDNRIGCTRSAPRSIMHNAVKYGRLPSNCIIACAKGYMLQSCCQILLPTPRTLRNQLRTRHAVLHGIPDAIRSVPGSCHVPDTC